jgi:Zn-dependent peptidase ImmA (M78 family)
MSRVSVKREVLRWAMARSGLTIDDLQGRFPKAQQWDAGESGPTLRQLEAIARLTSTPLGFFFLVEPPEERLPVPYFRTLGDERPSGPSPDLLETIQVMQQRQAWMREFLIEQGEEALAFVRSVQPAEPCASVAERIRRAMGLGEGWGAELPTWTHALRALREAAEEAGILVVVNGVVGNNTHRKLHPGEFRGFVLVDEYAPLVFVNGADGKAAQMFTLAHELAHVVFGSSAAFDLREMQPADDPTEQACNRVAAEFLIPERELRGVWPSVKGDPEPFQAIARRFKVSEIVAARRALDLGLVNKTVFLDFLHAYQADERRVVAAEPKRKRGDFYPTQNLRVGRRFASAVVRAVAEGKLLYSDAYKLTGLYGRSFERYAARLQMRALR